MSERRVRCRTVVVGFGVGSTPGIAVVAVAGGVSRSGQSCGTAADG